MNIRLIMKNTGALTASTTLSRAIAFFVGILLARYLGPESMGLYAKAYAFVNIFSYFNELGLSQLMVREGSRDSTKLPLYYGNALLVKAVMVVIVFAVMMLCLAQTGFSWLQCELIIILGVGMALNNINQTVYNYYQTKQNMAAAAGYQFLEALFIAVLTLGVIFIGGLGVLAVMAAHLAAFALVFILLQLAMRKQVNPVVDLRKIPRMIGEGLPFGLQRAVNAMIPNASIFVLSLMLVSDAEAGLFRVAQSLVVALIFLPNAFASALYPVLFQLGAGDQNQHQEVMEKVFKILAAVGIPGSFLMWITAPRIIDLLYGAKYADSAAIFAVLSWYFALECLNYPLGDVLTTKNRPWQRAVLQGISLGLLVALTVWAQSRFGLMGSAWAILAVEAFLFWGYYIYIRVRMYPIRIWRQLPGVVLASLAMTGVAWLTLNLHFLIEVSAAAVAYAVVLFVVDKDLRYLLKKALRRSPEVG